MPALKNASGANKPAQPAAPPPPAATTPAAPDRLNGPGMGPAVVSGEQAPAAPEVAKAAQQPAGASPSPGGPSRKPGKPEKVGGKVPAVGMWAIIWEPGAPGQLRPMPFQLIQQDMSGQWHGNVHKLGRVVQRHSKQYSSTPKLGCWSWPDD